MNSVIRSSAFCKDIRISLVSFFFFFHKNRYLSFSFLVYLHEVFRSTGVEKSRSPMIIAENRIFMNLTGFENSNTAKVEKKKKFYKTHKVYRHSHWQKQRAVQSIGIFYDHENLQNRPSTVTVEIRPATYWSCFNRVL